VVVLEQHVVHLLILQLLQEREILLQQVRHKEIQVEQLEE
jgi:hypothetical protein